AMIDCDASTVAHAVGDGGEHLHLGRKTRDWNTAQRRAISVRDGGRCRFPGCEFRHFDVHHMRPWEDGGLTDIDNGMCCCRRHHRLLHKGYRVEGRVDSELAFYRPDGSLLGTSLAAGCVMAGSGGTRTTMVPSR
ncbi:MAG TPA: HNH endonuclease signature motif containing protein, partial [Acidimicrobiales bacterium]|nr:HNH endonuclease signature motif containing protein [Acidimicrobiales bacterium]